MLFILKQYICNGKTENKYVNNIVPNPQTEKYRRHKMKSGRAQNVVLVQRRNGLLRLESLLQTVSSCE